MAMRRDYTREAERIPDGRKIYHSIATQRRHLLTAPMGRRCKEGSVHQQKKVHQNFLSKINTNQDSQFYSNLGFPDKLLLDIHEGEHEVDIPALLYFFNKFL